MGRGSEMKIEIDGIEYITNQQVKEMLGYNSPSNAVTKLLKKYITPLKIGSTPLWKKAEIEDYKNGKFTVRRIKNQNVEFNGVKYKSIKDMSTALGISQTQCSNYLRMKRLENQ